MFSDGRYSRGCCKTVHTSDILRLAVLYRWEVDLNLDLDVDVDVYFDFDFDVDVDVYFYFDVYVDIDLDTDIDVYFDLDVDVYFDFDVDVYFYFDSIFSYGGWYTDLDTVTTAATKTLQRTVFFLLFSS